MATFRPPTFALMMVCVTHLLVIVSLAITVSWSITGLSQMSSNSCSGVEGPAKRSRAASSLEEEIEQSEWFWQTRSTRCPRKQKETVCFCMLSYIESWDYFCR